MESSVRDAAERRSGGSAGDVAAEDAASEDAAVEDAASEDAAVEDAANEDVATDDAATDDASTTVEVRCTGHVRTEIGIPRMAFSFEGDTLRAFLEAFFDEYDVQDMLIAETEADATTRGWAPKMEDLPGNNYAKNPEGEQTRRYARVAVDGTFNEHLDGLDTPLSEGDRVSLMYPFIYCC